MQMRKADIVAYPRLEKYVSVELPLVNNSAAILAAIKKQAGAIPTKTLKDALLWGHGPMIKIVPGMAPLGEFSPGIKSNEVRLQKKMVKNFEAGGGLRRTLGGRLVYLVGVTLLHELTHWADDQDGADTPGEEGNLFETQVYGKIVI